VSGEARAKRAGMNEVGAPALGISEGEHSSVSPRASTAAYLRGRAQQRISEGEHSEPVLGCSVSQRTTVLGCSVSPRASTASQFWALGRAHAIGCSSSGLRPTKLPSSAK
jgi:hypothetical protein